MKVLQKEPQFKEQKIQFNLQKNQQRIQRKYHQIHLAKILGKYPINLVIRQPQLENQINQNIMTLKMKIQKKL